MPAPSVLGEGLLREDLGAKAGNSFRLWLKIARTQVKMNPVLRMLVIGHLLQKDLGALAMPSLAYPSTPVQNSAERSSWEQSITTTSSPRRYGCGSRRMT